MIAADVKTRCSSIALAAVVAVLWGAPAAQAANPIKLVQASQIGWEVDKATKGKVCVVAPGKECQLGRQSEEPGGLTFPEGVASTAGGSFYVSEPGNHRVQEFNSSGEFMLMFGGEVNVTKHKDICTEEEIKSEGVKCKAGLAGTNVGRFSGPQSVMVDPVSGDVYVADHIFVEANIGERVQKFTASGQFILEIGKEVNQRTHANLCTQKEVEEGTGVTCGPPALEKNPQPSGEHGVFDFAGERGNILADGGEHDLLYVGEAGRVQEFDANGVWAGEAPISGTVEAMAVDNKTSNLYVAYEGQSIIHELNGLGSELEHLEVHARQENNGIFGITGLAVDSFGRISVVAEEEGVGQFGALYDAVTGPQLPNFTIPEGAGIKAISFDGKEELYAVDIGQEEILNYVPQPVGELSTGAATCQEGTEVETSVEFTCRLNGDLNPFSVEKTEAWFEWGRTCAIGSDTPKENLPTVSELLPVSASVEGLRPNEAFCYRLAATDQSVQPPELLIGERVASNTPAVRPKIVGAPSASFVRSSSVDMYGELNPENTNTEYFFEYAPELQPGESPLVGCLGIKIDRAACPRVASTLIGESALYGRMGATLEASGLQPSTTYHYRLAASNQAGESNGGREEEGTFTTSLAPKVEAETGAFSDVTTTSALVSGVVNPDGQPATYTLELGVYQGAATQFGTVFSGPTGTTVEVKSLMLTGLQPGTEYGYRIKITSGYGNATGAIARFKTEGLPAALTAPSPLSLLPVPSIRFPRPVPSCKAGFARDRHGACVRVKKKIKKSKKSKRGKARHGRKR